MGSTVLGPARPFKSNPGTRVFSFFVAKERLQTASCRVHSKSWHSVPHHNHERQKYYNIFATLKCFFQTFGGLRSYSTQGWRQGLRGAAGVAVAPSVGQPGRRLCSQAPNSASRNPREFLERFSGSRPQGREVFS